MTSCAGLWPPLATPFRADLAIDHDAMRRHAAALLDEGAEGLAILGTTSEANSLTLDERRGVIDDLIAGGIPAAKLLPGTGACAIGDAVDLSRHATAAGAAGVLLLPPFFYKGVPDDGIAEYVSRVIEGVGDDRLRIYLYHIPQMAGAGWSLDLIGKLRERFPGIIAGLKDSSGDWPGTRAFIETFPDLAIFPASEAVLSDAIPLGAAGCISATANVNAREIAQLLATLMAGGTDAEAQARVTALREAVTRHPLVPSIKAILARRYDDPVWSNLRPPLCALDDAGETRLRAEEAVTAIEGQPA
ncbi:4-hydroxy-tetrahydrodipicolinate synthase [Palleronia aestuarii]|uniref:4-hydroxy-tetrahydrodipicolinate synthase n=1 Tax=Palleronia aestuarii TaxID=568105 RepID=A0A2W7P179_9RHOB|nr:dihydrodipicolinate synthase family protein [Palleronia aestuarii]PZX17202.1 4-hydroxy-tetrahydrodipicolinate synthase [Palleronia aestuarii]